MEGLLLTGPTPSSLKVLRVNVDLFYKPHDFRAMSQFVCSDITIIRGSLEISNFFFIT